MSGMINGVIVNLLRLKSDVKTVGCGMFSIFMLYGLANLVQSIENALQR